MANAGMDVMEAFIIGLLFMSFKNDLYPSLKAGKEEISAAISNATDNVPLAFQVLAQLIQ